MVWNGVDPTNKLGIERFSHFDISTKHMYLTGVTMGRFFDTIIDVDS